MSAVAAVDIGGTKIAAALVDDAGVIRERIRVDTPSGAPAILCVVAELVTDLRRRGEQNSAPVQAVGVGAPGVVDTAAGVVRSATQIVPGWAGTPVRDELTRMLRLPVAVANDVRAAAVGAALDPALRDCPQLLHVSVGTGVGGALIQHGRPVSGPHAVTGEIAHLLVPAQGAIACGCGRLDHLEAVAAGPAIAAAYARVTNRPIRSLTDVTALLRAGNQDARAVVRDAAHLLGRVLAGLVAAIDANAITLGGGVVHGIPEFATTVAEAFRAEALPPLRTLPVLVPGTAADAPLLGAAHLARQLGQETGS
ncbi:glucokinase [Actinoplanes octamycinicus]|uniref:Glucokinase n=1 Tax=Actinoplanes octamycinicus TaxID=135948 RepID=A0A7W7M9M1_9ACTN|nr:ROK family protein [Actinoplanes octamycinicus]MBB4742129.1 glucokinase [Actinoplanes octamycinicus]GIE60025.1 transcriptional regulator [Actinoplanes octamycinicus]